MLTSRRVLIFADSDNTYLAAQSFNRKIDWQKICNYLANPQEGRELIEMVIYVGLPPARERFEEQRKTKEKFVYWARNNGFLVVAKEGKAKGEEYETNIDVVMAMDAIELALEVKPDIVVLVTGDSDFAYLAEKLRRRGMRVEVASVEQSLGSELKSAANDPAVFWLNSICASTGVGVIHGMVSGFLNLDAGLDWIYEFPNSVWHQTDTKYLETPDCYFCSQSDGLTTEIEDIDTESDVENMGYW